MGTTADPALDLLRAMLSDGPAIAEREPGSHRTVYRRPTLTNLVPDIPGAVIAQRADHRISFAFTESDGTQVSYGGTISQDDLFRALHSAGLLTRQTR